MKLPKSITIKGKKWKIRRRHKIMLDGDKCDGLCQFPTRIIDIQRDLTGERLSTTMLHEKIHAIIFEYGLDKFLTIDQQEKICDALESELTDT